jgi:antitoxin component of RelBE/YafQ-DinJ toxin-antitoxin module
VGKSTDYIQLTIRIPPGLYSEVKRVSEQYGLTLNDSIIIILFNCLGDENE